MIRDSLIANNRASWGGGLAILDHDRATPIENQVIINSTISGNEAYGAGGGIYLQGPLSIKHSTISGNTSDINFRYGGTGGGIYVDLGEATIDHTIVAGNRDNTLAAHGIAGLYTANYSLVGEGEEFLSPLAENGGTVRTHALLPGSPAIDAGDPLASPGNGDVPLNDQRGFGFSRVVGDRIDIGAFESQGSGSPQTGSSILFLMKTMAITPQATSRYVKRLV